MSGERTAEGQQTGDDKGRREQPLGAPSLGEDARRYLRAGVAPEEGTEDHVLDRFTPAKLLEIGISAFRIGHRLQGHRGRHSDSVTAKEAQAHEHHLRVSASVSRFRFI